MKTTTIRTVAVAAAAGLLASLLAVDGASAASVQLTEAKRCRKAISTQGRVYAKKRLGLLLNCVDKLLKCEILEEVDSTNQNGCRGLAEDSCNDRLGSGSTTTLSKAQASFDSKAAGSCVVFGLTDMLATGSGGLWYGNDGNCSGSADIPTLMDCLRDEVEQEVDGVVGEVKPRAGILLANMGLGDEFPNLPLPPTVTVVVAATAPGSGVLVNPGTINVPVGSALRIEGDPNLSCGGGAMNGNLTATIGSQVANVKEPWGPTRFVILGPFTTVGVVPYTFDLKDQSCDDSTSGNVNVTP